MNTQYNRKHQIGLIFGKFYPLHCGHIYLIEKAVSQVDELHVILGCEQARDLKLFENSRMPKQPQVSDRFYWLKNTFKNRHNIHIHILDEADIAYYPNGWKDWSDRVKAILLKKNVTPTVIFTSELEDAKNHELYFGCPVQLIDVARDFINISATAIRNNPYENWQFIAKVAKPFFVKKVAIIGNQYKFDELPKQLANIYNTEYVSNGYVNYIHHEYLSNDRSVLDKSDYIRVAVLQAQRMDDAAMLANKVIFTSLDFHSLHHFYQKSFKQKNKLLTDLEANYHFDLVIHERDFSHIDSPLMIFETVIDKVERLLR